MPRPTEMPIGLYLARTSKAVSRAFDDVLRDNGGSSPTWLILISIKTHDATSQRDLAEAVGIRGATLTHHLDAMEADRLIARERDPENRRIQRVRLTPAGEKLFTTLRRAAAAFDNQLRRDLSDADLTALRATLGTLQRAVTSRRE